VKSKVKSKVKEIKYDNPQGTESFSSLKYSQKSNDEDVMYRTFGLSTQAPHIQ